MKRLPGRYDGFIASGENHIILQQDAFGGNQTFAVKKEILHKRLQVMQNSGMVLAYYPIR